MPESLSQAQTVSLDYGRFTVHGSRFTVHGSMFKVHGSWFMVHGSRFMVHGSRFTVHGSGQHQISAPARWEWPNLSHTAARGGRMGQRRRSIRQDIGKHTHGRRLLE